VKNRLRFNTDMIASYVYFSLNYRTMYSENVHFSDFAYPTVKDRMPVILTKVIDTVFRKKTDIRLEFGEVSKVDLQSCIILFLHHDCICTCKSLSVNTFGY